MFIVLVGMVLALSCLLSDSLVFLLVFVVVLDGIGVCAGGIGPFLMASVLRLVLVCSSYLLACWLVSAWSSFDSLVFRVAVATVHITAVVVGAHITISTTVK
jgi:hypothetical protein